MWAAVAAVAWGESVAWGQDVRRDEPPKPPAQAKLTSPPELIEGAEPVYPAEAAAQGLAADVKVRIWIDETGKVTKVGVVEPVGHGFDEAAIEAALKYRFRPAELDGKPGAIVVETVVHFTITQEVVELPPEAPEVEEEAPGEVSGVVRERGTRSALAGATVAIGATAVEVVTDGQGRFHVRDAPSGKHRLVVVLSGYDRFEAPLEIQSGERVDVTVYLRPIGASPYETVVEAERDKYVVTRHTVPRRVMTTVPGTFGDPVRVVQNLPGVARSPFGLGLLIIRGTSPEDSSLFVDGHRVPNLFHFLGGPSVLNAEFLENIELYPGGFPVRYGGALGGVISVETRPTASDGIHGQANVDVMYSGIYARAPITKGVSVSGAARRSYIDLLLPPFLPSGTVVVPVFWDYQLRLDAKLERRATLSVLWFGADDRLDVTSARDDAPDISLGAHIGFHRLIATLARPVGRWRLSFSPMVGRDAVDFDVNDAFGLTTTQTIVGVRARAVGPLSECLRLEVGIDEEYRFARYDFAIPLATDVLNNTGEPIFTPEPDELTISVDTLSFGVHADLAWDATPAISLIPGVRVDAWLMDGEPRLTADARVVAKWKTGPKTTVKGYAGLFHQAPAAELFDPTIGNPGLSIQRAIQTGLGVEQRLPWRVSLNAEIYYSTRDDIPTETNEAVIREDGTVDQLNNLSQGKGRSYGLELLVKRDITRSFYGWLSYTLSRSQQQDEPGDPWELTDWDQTHNMILVGSWHTDGGWELGGRFRMSTGRPETPILGGAYDVDDNDYNSIRGEQDSGRGALFHQLDLRAEKTWLFKTWSISAYLDIQNLYNAENPEARQWDYRYKDSAPVRGLPFLPILGVKGRW